MSKKMISAFVKSQYAQLQEKDIKERMQYVVAKVEDGMLYDLKGNCYGKWDGEDTVFIAEEDLKLSRIASTRITNYNNAINAYFSEDGEEAEDGEETEETVDSSEPDDVLETEDGEIAKKIKKALKKGKTKKAVKLLGEISDKKLRKALAKEIDNA